MEFTVRYPNFPKFNICRYSIEFKICDDSSLLFIFSVVMVTRNVNIFVCYKNLSISELLLVRIHQLCYKQYSALEADVLYD